MDAGCGPRARMDAIRSRAAPGPRSTGTKTGPHGACLTRGGVRRTGKTPRPPRLGETRFWSRAIGVTAGGECRGEAPEGGRATTRRAAALCAAIMASRLSALRLPFLVGRIFFTHGGYGDSGAEALRERFLASSLPGLTRQSMQNAGLLKFAALFDSRHVSIGHRVKPGGDVERGLSPRVIANQRVRPKVVGPMINSAKQSRWLAREAGLLRRVAPRNDERQVPLLAPLRPPR
jgi:hypothetical protein